MARMIVRILSALLLVAAADASAQGAGNQPPALTRHGNWAEGRVTGPGREACIAGAPVPGRGSFQATIGRAPSGSVALVLAVRVERERFATGEPVRFLVDGRSFELPGDANAAGGPVMLVAASTEEEARALSDLLVAMRRGRELRIQVGGRPALDVSLTGASAALGAMRACAQRAGMMPR